MIFAGQGADVNRARGGGASLTDEMRGEGGLFSEIGAEALRAGVYTCRHGGDAFRVVVAGELPREQKNALLHLLSTGPEQVKYGSENFQIQSPDSSTIVNQLFKQYRREGLNVPYTMKDFKRDVVREYLEELTPEDRVAFLEEAEFLKRLSPEQRLAGLSAEQRLAGLSAEQRLADFSPEQIEAYLKRLR